MPLNLRALSSFSMAHYCVSLFWAAFPMLVLTSGHTLSGLVVAWIFVSLHPEHMYPFGGLSLNKVNFVNPFQESDKLLFASTSTNHLYDFLARRPDRMSGPGYINVFQWNSFFFRHIELKSRFIVMTITEVNLNRPEVFPGFSVVSWFCRLKIFRFALKFLTQIFTFYRLFLSQSGFSEFMVSSQQFCCTSCNREYKYVSLLWR